MLRPRDLTRLNVYRAACGLRAWTSGTNLDLKRYRDLATAIADPNSDNLMSMHYTDIASAYDISIADAIIVYADLHR